MEKFLASIWLGMCILAVLFALVITPGCSVHTGIGVHTPGADAPEISGMDNPLGIISLRSKEKWGDVRGECTHVSSLPVWEKGYGFNYCAGMVEW